MAKTVVGLFDTMEEAQNVVQDLVNSGFNRNDVGLVANDARNQYAKMTGKDATAAGSDSAATEGEGHATKAGDDAGAGAVGGTVVGGVIGLLVGLGALAIPGIGPVVAAGTLATVLGSTALGAGIGAAAGGLIGALVGMGVPKEDAEYYNEGVRRGGVLVTVKSKDDMAQGAYDLMQRHGAVDIDERGAEWKQTGFAGHDPNAQPYSAEEIDRFRTAPRTAATTASDAMGAATSTATSTIDTAANTVGTAAANVGNTAANTASTVVSTTGGAMRRGGGRIYTSTGLEDQNQK